MEPQFIPLHQLRLPVAAMAAMLRRMRHFIFPTEDAQHANMMAELHIYISNSQIHRSASQPTPKHTPVERFYYYIIYVWRWKKSTPQTRAESNRPYIAIYANRHTKSPFIASTCPFPFSSSLINFLLLLSFFYMNVFLYRYKPVEHHLTTHTPVRLLNANVSNLCNCYILLFYKGNLLIIITAIMMILLPIWIYVRLDHSSRGHTPQTHTHCRISRRPPTTAVTIISCYQIRLFFFIILSFDTPTHGRQTDYSLSTPLRTSFARESLNGHRRWSEYILWVDFVFLLSNSHSRSNLKQPHTKPEVQTHPTQDTHSHMLSWTTELLCHFLSQTNTLLSHYDSFIFIFKNKILPWRCHRCTCLLFFNWWII